MDVPQIELEHDGIANSTESWICGGGAERSLPALALVRDDQSFLCPGESHPISYSVHVARQAAGFLACGNCRHRQMAAGQNDGRPTATGRSLVSADGIRGVYLNEIDRNRAANWSSAFAALLWDDQPRVGRVVPSASMNSEDTQGTSKPSTRRGPVAVIGFDERPSSPDVVLGVSLGLRRMGCQVIDLGQTTRPCFHFAVHHLRAAGGVYVGGSGCPPAFTGFDFARRNAIPLLDAVMLRDLEQRSRTLVTRPTRIAGHQQPFHAAIPYQAGLWSLFHALRPLKVVCGTATRSISRTLDLLFARLPCQLSQETLPVRKRDLDDSHDADVRRIGAAVVASQAHLGLIIDDDGERCAFLNERGQLLPSSDLAKLMMLFELHEHRTLRAVVDASIHTRVSQSLGSVAGACQVDSVAAVEIPSAIMDCNASLGFTANHRVWCGGDYPACDAIKTLARVLQALSLSDAAMSEVLRTGTR
jgi:phosphomannomutase